MPHPGHSLRLSSYPIVNKSFMAKHHESELRLKAGRFL